MKRIIPMLITVFFAVMLISSCTSQRTPTQAITVLNNNLTEPVCDPGPFNYTAGVPWTWLNGNGVINSQAEYDVAYHGWAPAGEPTPTPVPIDFTKHTLVGKAIVQNCGTAAPGFTGFSTDCAAVYFNQADGVDCYAGSLQLPTCHSVTYFYVTYLIDKTTLPVMIKTNTTQCDGSVSTVISPLK